MNFAFAPFSVIDFPIIKLNSFFVNTEERDAKSSTLIPFALLIAIFPDGNLIDVLKNFLPLTTAVFPIPACCNP